VSCALFVIHFIIDKAEVYNIEFPLHSDCVNHNEYF